MSKFRIEYKSGDIFASFNREEFFILVHYANSLSVNRAKKLYFAGETEYIYRFENGLPLGGLDFYESNQPHWNTVDLKDVVSFIDMELLPQLQNLTNENLISALGGWSVLKSVIDQGPSYTHRFGIVSDDGLFEEIYEYIYLVNSLKEIIVNSLILGQPYSINYIE